MIPDISKWNINLSEVIHDLSNISSKISINKIESNSLLSEDNLSQDLFSLKDSNDTTSIVNSNLIYNVEEKELDNYYDNFYN